MNALEVRHLTKKYRGRPALEDLDLVLAHGQIVGLMGDNGSGKTTLLKILAGVLADWTGEVKVAGHAPGPESKALVSFLPDASFLNDDDTCEQAVAQYERFFSDFDPGKARSMIEFFGLPQDPDPQGDVQGNAGEGADCSGDVEKCTDLSARRADLRCGPGLSLGDSQGNP